MAKAYIRNHTEYPLTVEFDPTDYDNNNYFNLFKIAVCDGMTYEIKYVEKEIDEGSYRYDIDNTEGWELFDEQLQDNAVEVIYNGEAYECPCTYHVAYVIDTEE